MINSDLKYIKKHYGEKFAHLCRDLFPTILETEGLLKDIIAKHFAPSRNLYYDIVENFLQDEFKSYIYSFVDVEQDSPQSIDFSPEELMRKAGYILYPECQTEEDIQKFRKYYASGEELCTFGGQRLKSCRVWFAVKENVDEIKRENFPHPTRQDEYGTSVISIQFSRTGNNYLSIKNRYNHMVNNPDATFSNDLDNIIPGLSQAFAQHYGLTINGGNINIDASGDGIDVNGNAYIYSGNIIVYSPTSGADSALDYDGEFVMAGGTLIAGGSSEMTTSISNNSKQYNVLIYFDSTITGEVKILNNDEMISYNSNKKYSSLIISSPELVKNTTYTIEVNNDKYKTFTISSITTNVGNKIMSNNQFRR